MANHNKSGGIMDRVLGFFAYLFVSVKRLFTRKNNSTPSEMNTRRKNLGHVQRTSKVVADSTVSHSISDAYRTHRSASASRSVTTQRAGRRVYFSGREQKFKKVITAIAFSAIAIVGIVLLVSALSKGSGAAKVSAPTVTVSSADSFSNTDCKATLTFGGCVKLNSEIISSAKTDTGYDFTNYFSELNSLFDSDINVVDLVGLIDADGNNTNLSTYSLGNYPIELAQALSDIGVNYVTTSNRSSLFKGFDALRRSTDNLSKNDINSLGVHTDEKSANSVTVREVNGIKVGMASYYCPNTDNYDRAVSAAKEASTTDAQLSYAVDQAPITNIKDVILDDVSLMNSSGAEVIFIMLDWGYDSSQKYTDDNRNSLAQDLIDAGVDVIIGTGPNYTQKITKKAQTGGTEDSYVFYSLGNLISDIDGGKTDALYYSMAVTFTLERKADESQAVITNVTAHPVFNCREDDDSSDSASVKFRVVPAVKYYSSDNRPDFFSDSQWKACKKAFDAVSSFASKSGVTTGTYSSLFGTAAGSASADNGVSVTI